MTKKVMARKTSDDMKLAWLILLIVLVWIAGSWADMILVGVAHDNWWALMPPMGFRVSLILTGIVMAARILGGAIGAFFKD